MRRLTGILIIALMLGGCGIATTTPPLVARVTASVKQVWNTTQLDFTGEGATRSMITLETDTGMFDAPETLREDVTIGAVHCLTVDNLTDTVTAIRAGRC